MMRKRPRWRALRLLECVCLFLLPVGAGAQGFTRGLNANPWFTKPAHNRDGSFASTPYPKTDRQTYRADLLKMKQSGFDFIRLPITSEPIIHASTEDRHAALENIRTVAATALDVGLNILLDFHVVTGGGTTFVDITKDPRAAESYLALEEDAARTIASLDHQRIFLETMNEPTTACDDPFWKTFQHRIVDRVRSVSAEIRTVLTGSCYDDIDGLKQVDLKSYGDPKDLYVTFHYYRPFWFTHQGATWTGDHGVKILTGVPWPPQLGNYDASMDAVMKNAPNNFYYQHFGQEAVEQASTILRRYYSWQPDEKFIVADFSKLAAWADEQGIPRSHIIMGEFGVLKVERRWVGADIDSAARWISTVREAAERNGFPWAMWSYKEGMALAETEQGSVYYPELVKALGLREVP